MNPTNKNKMYRTPEVSRIKLDNEISLILVSGGNDPGDPGMLGQNNQIRQNKDPFFIG
jgi:hypothetical protein